MILADTHVVAWLAFNPGRLSRKARAAVDDARRNGDGVAISDITLLELATLASKGRIRLDISLESFLRDVEARFVVLAHQRPRLRPSHGTAGGISQRPGGSDHRSYGARRRTGSRDC